MTDFATYRQIPATNASLLKHMARSPLHYHYFSTHESPDSPAMFKGRFMHCAVLEPDEFPKRYTVWPGARRGKDWTAFSEASEQAGMQVLTQSEYDEALAVRDAVRAHAVAARLLTRGVAEQTVKWTDAETGLDCKARLDFIGDGYALDFKTSRDISERSFSRTTHDLLYHVQVAHYMAGLAANGHAISAFYFIAVESNPPHDVRAGLITEDALYAGEQERRRLLRLVADCTASGEWPGAFPDESAFDLPEWYYAQGEQALEGYR